MLRRINNKKGTILIVSFWIMAILSIFAIILTHRLSFQIKLLRNRLLEEKAFYIAKAGVERVLAERQQALNTPGAFYADSFDSTWFNSKELFKEQNFGEGKFSVENSETPDFYGMSDENARININKAPANTLKELLKQIGLKDEASDALAVSIVDWRDKNSGFDAIEEILLVKDMTSDIFYGKDSDGNGIIDLKEKGLKEYITVYGSGIININTASGVVLSAVLDRILSDYIISVRQSGTKFVCDETGKNDDKNIKSSDSSLSPQEITMLAALVRARDVVKTIDVVSSVFKVRSLAAVRGVESSVEAVAQFDGEGLYNFISWSQK